MQVLVALITLGLTGWLLAKALIRFREPLGRPGLRRLGSRRIAFIATAVCYAADYPVRAILGEGGLRFLGFFLACTVIWQVALIRMPRIEPRRAIGFAIAAAAVTVLLQLAASLLGGPVAPDG